MSNSSGRVLAIGDVHGCDVALDLLLSKIELTSDDMLVILGDVVDRGPNSKRALDLIINLSIEQNVTFLMGNHEEMMLDAYTGGKWGNAWLRYGGQETLDSYGGGFGLIPDHHLSFMQNALDYYETETEIFIHANLEPGVPVAEQQVKWLRWHHLTGSESPHMSGKRVVCGHTRLVTGKPAVFDGWCCIDTWACGGKFLTCLDCTNDLAYQTNQNREWFGPMPLDEIASPLLH